MRKILCLLSAFLLFTLPLASTAAQQTMPPGIPHFVAAPDAPAQPVQLQLSQPDAVLPFQPIVVPPRNTGQQTVAPQEQVKQDYRSELQDTLRELLTTINGLPRDGSEEQEIRATMEALQTIIRRLQRATPAAPQPYPYPSVSWTPSQPMTRPAARNPDPLTAEREKAYIELARQYFFVFTSTPVEPPITLRSLAEQMTAAIPLPAAEENGDEEEAEEKIDPKEEWTQKREEILENFVDCIRKISPAAQIALITELIRSSHTNEELKLLEGLLDEVLTPPVPPAGGRVPQL